MISTRHFVLLSVFVLIFPDLGAQTKIIAHRGYSSVAPENSLAAFKKAIESGADYFELDVLKTADDSLVVIHDASVKRTSSNGTKGKIAKMTYEELTAVKVGYSKKFGEKYADEKIPTLREALSLAKGKINVCIEIKVEGIEEEVLKTVNDLDVHQEVIIFSFIYPVLEIIRQLDSEIELLYLAYMANQSHLEKAGRIKAKAIGVGSGTKISNEFLENARRNNLEVWKWTVNDEHEMKKLITLGIDGIITNFPKKALEILENNP
jgi:glycerophosphoryl diester phosphodiesterase